MMIFLNKSQVHKIDGGNNANVSIKGNLLTLKFVKDGYEYYYYGERNINHLDTIVSTPEGTEINFYPGFIPRVKAKNLGHSHLFFEDENGRKKINATDEIFNN